MRTDELTKHIKIFSKWKSITNSYYAVDEICDGGLWELQGLTDLDTNIPIGMFKCIMVWSNKLEIHETRKTPLIKLLYEFEEIMMISVDKDLKKIIQRYNKVKRLVND